MYMIILSYIYANINNYETQQHMHQDIIPL